MLLSYCLVYCFRGLPACLQGEIDEREFLLTDFGALASPRTMPGAVIHMPATALGSTAGPDSHTVQLRPLSESVNGSSHAAAARSADTAADRGHLQQQLSPLAALAAAATSEQQPQHVQKPPLGPNMARSKAGGLVLQGLQSPLPMMGLGPPVPATPISQAMGSVAWLRGLTRGISEQPSPALQRYMQAAGAEAGAVLVQKVKAAAEAVFMSDGASGEAGVVGGLQGLQHGLAQDRQTEVGSRAQGRCDDVVGGAGGLRGGGWAGYFCPGPGPTDRGALWYCPLW
jgi:hypothetical protein